MGWWVAAAQPLGAEGVAALHKELEDEHAQGKGIMLRLSHDAADGLAMQLRRGVLQLTDRTRVIHGLIATYFLYLERIRVDQADQSRGCDQHIALVQIADYVTAHVQSGERGRQIAGGAVQVAPIETWQGRLPPAWVEDFQHGHGCVNMRHQVASQLVLRIVQHAGRPGQ